MEKNMENEMETEGILVFIGYWVSKAPGLGPVWGLEC